MNGHSADDLIAELTSAARTLVELRRDVSEGRIELQPDAAERLWTALEQQAEQAREWSDRADRLAVPSPFTHAPIPQQATAGQYDSALSSALEQYEHAVSAAAKTVRVAARGEAAE